MRMTKSALRTCVGLLSPTIAAQVPLGALIGDAQRRSDGLAPHMAALPAFTRTDLKSDRVRSGIRMTVFGTVRRAG